MKKAAALILVLTMVLALCACGGSKNPLIGTWEKQGNAPYADRIVFTDKVVSAVVCLRKLFVTVNFFPDF